MTQEVSRTRILDPLERFSEILFGLIVVLSFTGALRVSHLAREDVRQMFVAAILCNLAWGIIDAAFYLIACLTEHARVVKLLLGIQRCTEPARAHKMISEAVPRKIAEALSSADWERIHAHLKQLPPPTRSIRLTRENWLGALGVFCLVFLSTFPVVIPFIFIHDLRLALQVSNGIAIASLFGAGHMLAAYAGLHRIGTGLIMVAIGGMLVALTIALGG